MDLGSPLDRRGQCLPLIRLDPGGQEYRLDREVPERLALQADPIRQKERDVGDSTLFEKKNHS